MIINKNKIKIILSGIRNVILASLRDSSKTVDINVRDRWGQTPLDEASKSENYRITAILKKKKKELW